QLTCEPKYEHDPIYLFQKYTKPGHLVRVFLYLLFTFSGSHCSASVLKLRIVKFCVESAFRKEFLVFSLFNNISVLQNENPVRITDRGKPVGNDKTCSSFHQIIHRFLDLNFCPCINRTCRFVKNKNLRICQNGSCNRQELLLTL